MNQILVANGIKSNNWSRIYQKVSYKDINRFVSEALLHNLRDKMSALSAQSDSTWSRNLVTIVFDDSIFKQWLSDAEVKLGQYFSTFFSGQVGKTVYGFRVTLIGVSIGDTFYPTHLKLTPKGKDTKETACELLRQLHDTIHKLASAKKWEIPNLFVSADSGFDCPLFLKTCADLSKDLEITPICVPKRSNLIEFGNFKGTVAEFIKIYFCPLEAAHIREHEVKGVDAPPFTIRMPVFYTSKGQEVVLLVFRLGKSKKVSAIYCTDMSIKSKTLRRRWFQRTLIEQFFRFLKDTLKIQQSKNTDKEGFERKLFVFVFKALQCQLFRNFCRRRFRNLRGWSFSRIRQVITFEGIEKEYLQSLLKNMDQPFAENCPPK
jgi:hypothetical protein